MAYESAKTITEQGLEKAIEDNFKLFCDDIIEPSMNLESGIIEFSAKTKIPVFCRCQSQKTK